MAKSTYITDEAHEKLARIIKDSKGFLPSTGQRKIIISQSIEICDILAKKEGKTIPQLYLELVK